MMADLTQEASMARYRPWRKTKLTPSSTIFSRIKNRLRQSLALRIGAIAAAAAILAAAVVVIVLTTTAPAAGTPGGTNIASTSPTPSPLPTPTPDPTLKKGDSNEKVQQLQQRLMDLDYMDIDEPTLLFGPATKHAVELFQRQHSLEQNGIADEATLSLIYSDQAQKYMLLEGTRGTDVDSLQRQLITLGYLKKATGYYGTETIAAVEAFQKQNKLSADGKTGEETLNLIYSPDAKASPQVIQQKRRAANINKMIQIAVKQLGKPYISGHEGPNSYDCSGLIFYCLKQGGSNRGRFNAQGYANVSDWTKITSMGKLRKGDLLFFWSGRKGKVGHVAIYVGGGMMIDASSSNGKVVKRSCLAPWCRRDFVYARRPW
jgi:peptidoglycan hydrolase-like protein with peptidoglycan-binding domain